jgi:hypothetical protein
MVCVCILFRVPTETMLTYSKTEPSYVQYFVYLFNLNLLKPSGNFTYSQV